MKQRTNITSIVSPLRLWPQRLLFAFAVLAGLALSVAGKNDALFIDRTKIFILDFMAPVLSALSAPVTSTQRLIENVGDYLSLRDTNRKLEQENLQLLQWQQVARTLKVENENLRRLMQFKGPPNSFFITAPVIGEAQSGFLKSIIVMAGRNDKLGKGQAVLSDYGLVGRVLDVGNNVSRILLLTDISSRLPVLIERSHALAILSGTSAGLPELILANAGADIRIGDLLITSGAGGVIPWGLPVGKVVANEGGRLKVQLYADLEHLSYVRVIDYGLEGLLGEDILAPVEEKPLFPKAKALQ